MHFRECSKEMFGPEHGRANARAELSWSLAPWDLSSSIGTDQTVQTPQGTAVLPYMAQSSPLPSQSCLSLSNRKNRGNHAVAKQKKYI